MRHFQTLDDVSPEETHQLVKTALALKLRREAGEAPPRLPGRVLGLLFEKPSLRTRVSFEAAFAHLGGTSIFLSGDEVGLGRRESIGDVGRVLSSYVDLLAIRTFSHSVVVELAANAGCPIINALSDLAHPCQALADLMTIRETFGRIEGIRLAFIGDGNNVARSLATAAAHCGLDFVLSAPAGFEFSPDFLAGLAARAHKGTITVELDPFKAVDGADVIYTDVWASMGQEQESAMRKQVFAGHQVNQALLGRAKSTARFMHCLPAHRGEEVTADVIDGPRSIVVLQAANRLHAHKALMLWLLSTQTLTGQ